MSNEDSFNIDDIINEIDDGDDEQELEENEENSTPVVAPSKEVKNEEENLPDATEEEELMQSVVQMAMEDRVKADHLYNTFAPEVAMGRDRSQASKEAMAKAIELKISSAKNIIELIKLKKGDKTNNVGVFFGETMSGKKAGINIKNITGDD